MKCRLLAAWDGWEVVPNSPNPALCSTLAACILCLIQHQSSGPEFASLWFLPDSELWCQLTTPSLGSNHPGKKEEFHMPLSLALRVLKQWSLRNGNFPGSLIGWSPAASQRGHLSLWELLYSVTMCEKCWSWDGWGHSLTRMVCAHLLPSV